MAGTKSTETKKILKDNTKQHSLGRGFPCPIVLVPWYKLSLCHTPIKPDLLGFLEIGIFVWWLRNHVIKRFASFGIRAWLY
jgi:hypothetical protein